MQTLHGSAPRSTVAAVAGRELSKGADGPDSAVLGTKPKPVGEVAGALLLARLQAEALRLGHVVHALDGGGFRLTQQATGLYRNDLATLGEVARLLAIVRQRAP